MRRVDVDPASLEGDELERWYRRSPGEVEAEREAVRQQLFDQFFAPVRRADGSEGADAGSTEGGAWREARVAVRPLPTLPQGSRVGPPNTASAVAPSGGRGFFDTYAAVPNPALGPAYFTDLPSPLMSSRQSWAAGSNSASAGLGLRG